jgi:ribosomal protein L31E
VVTIAGSGELKISFKDQQILNIWCPYVPPEKPKLMEELCNHINRKMSENTILVDPNLNQTLVEWSLDGPLPKLCPVISTSNQDGRQAKNRKKGGGHLNWSLLL